MFSTMKKKRHKIKHLFGSQELARQAESDHHRAPLRNFLSFFISFHLQQLWQVVLHFVLCSCLAESVVRQKPCQRKTCRRIWGDKNRCHTSSQNCGKKEGKEGEIRLKRERQTITLMPLLLSHRCVIISWCWVCNCLKEKKTGDKGKLDSY